MGTAWRKYHCNYTRNAMVNSTVKALSNIEKKAASVTSHCALSTVFVDFIVSWGQILP